LRENERQAELVKMKERWKMYNIEQDIIQSRLKEYRNRLIIGCLMGMGIALVFLILIAL